MDKKQSHLEMIQGIINRLSQNSFLLKGWSVVLVSGLFALAANNSNISFIYLAYFPVLSFWMLDGYFLRQERLFRALYEKVCITSKKEVNFSMDVSIVDEEVKPYFEVVFSKTLLAFHGTIIISIIAVMVIVLLIS